MKEKQGFTLIELLAVIVILAIIALISTPIVLNIIRTSRKGASITSARGYIRAVNNDILANEMDQVNMFQNGTYNIDELLVEVSGNLPEKGTVTIDNDKVSKAELCFNGYLIKYDGTTYKINGECKKISTVTLNINESKENKKAENLSVEFNIENYKNGMTNISCNNGATLSIDGNILKVDNVFTDTECNISASLTNTITELDDTENYILMINDDTLTKDTSISTEVNFNVNGHQILLDGYFGINTRFTFMDDSKKMGKLLIQNGSRAFNMMNNGNLYIDYVNIEQDSDNTSTDKYGIWMDEDCNGCSLTIKDANINVGNIAVGIHSNASSSVVYIENGIYKSNKNVIETSSDSIINIDDGIFYGMATTIHNIGIGAINIHGGTFVSNHGIVVSNEGAGIIKIDDSINKVYVMTEDYSDSRWWSKVIFNKGAGNVYIRGKIADKCGDEINNTGICLYNKYGRSVLNENGSTGSIYIAGASIKSIGNYAVQNIYNGNIYICNADIDGTSLDISNDGTGYIYYTSNTTLKNKTIGGSTSSSNVILNDEIICE